MGYVAHFLAPDPAPAPRTCPPASCGDWYQPITVPIVADPFFQLAPGRENLRTFGKQPHLLSGIRGPLAVEGGTTAADRSLQAAVLLPGEDNRPPFRVAAQPPEWQQIDTLNVYDDGSKEDLTGTLTSTALTGLNMGDGLDFSDILCDDPVNRIGCKTPFGEPGIYPGGISYGSISIDANGVFTTDGTLSTVEIVNILLGEGNDHLTIQSTLQPGGDFNPITGLRGELAHHGGITAVHGGGNAAPEGRRDVRPRRADRRHRQRDGRADHAERRPLVGPVRLRRRPAGDAPERRLVHDHRLRDRPRQVRARRHDVPRRRPGRLDPRRR